MTQIYVFERVAVSMAAGCAHVRVHVCVVSVCQWSAEPTRAAVREMLKGQQNSLWGSDTTHTVTQ